MKCYKIALAIIFLGFIGWNFPMNASSSNPQTLGDGSLFTSMYNPQNEETLTGKIVTLSKFSSWGETHISLRADTYEEISVYLSPQSYLNSKQMELHIGDQVTITGSRIYLQGKPAIIAAKIRKGDRVLMLRDNYGNPLWGALSF